MKIRQVGMLQGNGKYKVACSFNRNLRDRMMKECEKRHIQFTDLVERLCEKAMKDEIPTVGKTPNS